MFGVEVDCLLVGLYRVGEGGTVVRVLAERVDGTAEECVAQHRSRVVGG